MKLVFALKESACFSSLVALVVKMKQVKGVFVVNAEGAFFGEPKGKVPAPTFTSISNSVVLISRYIYST